MEKPGTPADTPHPHPASLLRRLQQCRNRHLRMNVGGSRLSRKGLGMVGERPGCPGRGRPRGAEARRACGHPRHLATGPAAGSAHPHVLPDGDALNRELRRQVAPVPASCRDPAGPWTQLSLRYMRHHGALRALSPSPCDNPSTRRDVRCGRPATRLDVTAVVTHSSDSPAPDWCSFAAPLGRFTRWRPTQQGVCQSWRGFA